MDGFVVPRDIYKLEFAGDKYAGIVVRVEPASFATLLYVDDMFQSDEERTPQDRRKSIDELHQLFVAHLADWNLIDEKTRLPVEPTVEGLRSQQPAFVNAVITAWRTTPIEVPAPLERPSSDGEPLEELQIPMEPPSVSLVS